MIVARLTVAWSRTEEALATGVVPTAVYFSFAIAVLEVALLVAVAYVASGSPTAVLNIAEGCVLVGPRNVRFFIFSDCLLTILHAMYLVSNKVSSN